MYETAFQQAFEYLPDEFIDKSVVDIIDYGCNQAIGTICYADYLRNYEEKQIVRKIILIESSEIALKRAALHASCFFPQAEIITINKKLDDLDKDDLCLDINVPRLHILSNVLHFANNCFNLENFAQLINSYTICESQFICIEPLFNCAEKDELPVYFFERLYINPYYKRSSSEGNLTKRSNDSYQIVMGQCNGLINKVAYRNILKKFISYGQTGFVRKVKKAYIANGEIAFTLERPIIGCNLKLTNNISFPLYSIVDLFKKDDEKRHLCYLLIEYPKLANYILKYATIHICQEYSKNDNGIINFCPCISIGKSGEKIANDIADILLGLPNDNIALIKEFASDAENKKQHKEAFGYYKLAAELGDTEAQFNLGVCYDNGQGVVKDEIEALKWYQKAAERGNINALQSLKLRNFK